LYHKKKINQENLVLYQASFILPHCLWLSLLPATPNKHFVAQKKVNQDNLVLNANFGIPLDSVKSLPCLLTPHHHWLDAA
jgi:hypothetical protein